MTSWTRKHSSDLSTMYSRHPLYLWVEDEETRTYLQTLWIDEEPLIGYYVAGGHSHIKSIVDAAHADFCTHVLGLRDRDFTESNKNRWNDPTLRVFVGDAVEIENYLLDADAIANCEVNTAGKSADEIARKFEELARPLVWWMSCRATISKIRTDALEEFPEHPSRKDVNDFRSAKDAILNKNWWSKVLPDLQTTWGKEANVENSLSENEAQFRHMLSDQSWQQKFSGKEILTDLLPWVWTKNRPPDPQGRVQFVQEIAKAQRAKPPAELTALRNALEKRSA